MRIPFITIALLIGNQLNPPDFPICVDDPGYHDLYKFYLDYPVLNMPECPNGTIDFACWANNVEIYLSVLETNHRTFRKTHCKCIIDHPNDGQDRAHCMGDNDQWFEDEMNDWVNWLNIHNSECCIVTP